MGLRNALADELETHEWTVEDTSNGVGTVTTTLSNDKTGNHLVVKYSDWPRLKGGNAKVTIEVNGDEETYTDNAIEQIRNALREHGA